MNYFLLFNNNYKKKEQLQKNNTYIMSHSDSSQQMDKGKDVLKKDTHTMECSLSHSFPQCCFKGGDNSPP